jgi:Domain of unknown function (DUF3576)
MKRHFVAVFSLLLICCGLVACGTNDVRPVALNEYYNDETSTGTATKAFGDQGLSFSLFDKTGGQDQGSGGALGVNAYLWRAALDVLSFMPLSSADPFGGVIITDWYTPPTSTDERLKATAYILGRQLRSDGIRISVFRETLQNGQWVDAPVSPSTAGELEDRVLARARELRSQAGS